MLSQLETAYTKIIEKLQSWLETIVTMLPNILVAVIVVLVFYQLAKFVRNIFIKTLKKISRNEAVNDLVRKAIFLVIVVAGTFIALGILNLDKTVTSLLAGLGILDLALGFAFKDIAANFLSGIYMAIKSPINVGDIINC